MATARRFDKGDSVVHPHKPEWGEGVVNHAINIKHEGMDAQRLVVDFKHRPRVTLNTAIAPLVAKDHATMSATKTTTGGGWLADLERATGHGKGTGIEKLHDLPDAVDDPFISDAARLKATLALYRFSTEPRALFDWAIAQTGYEDPLSHFTRHEMEQAFTRFARNREEHLRKLAFSMKRSNQQRELDAALRETKNVEARNALKKALRG